MKIATMEIETRVLPLKKVFRTALRETREIRETTIFITTEDGTKGIGAACANAKVTGELLGGIESGLKYIFSEIKGMDLENFDYVMEKVQNCIVGNSAAKAAIDMALYRIYTRSLGVPLWKFLGGFNKEIETDLTISIDTMDKMCLEAKEAMEKGFKSIKVKLSHNQDHIGLIKEIRATVGKDTKLILDANQSWSPKKAVQIINALEPYVIELVEQPVPAKDLYGLKWVKENVAVPIMADESAFSLSDVLLLVKMDAVDIINIKLMKCGGIYQALKINAVAEAAGIPCMIGSMMEGDISVIAAASLAAAKKNIRYADLDSLYFLDMPINSSKVQFQGATISFK